MFWGVDFHWQRESLSKDRQKKNVTFVFPAGQRIGMVVKTLVSFHVNHSQAQHSGVR